MFGNYVEARLNELDPDSHKPMYTLEQLLADPMPDTLMNEEFDEDEPDIESELAEFMNIPGGVKVRKAKPSQTS